MIGPYTVDQLEKGMCSQAILVDASGQEGAAMVD